MKKSTLLFSFVIFLTLITCHSAFASVYYPHVAGKGSWGTEICAVNTGSTTITGTFEAYDNNGNAVSNTIGVTLAPNARTQVTVGTEFTNAADIGYIIFKTDSGDVIGYTKFYINGQYRVAVPATADITVGDLYISHIASNATWWTGISIVNTTSAAKALTIEFDNGTQKTVSLAAKAHKAFSIKSLFGETSQPDLHSAVIKNADGIVGLELFGSTNQLSGILLKNQTTQNMYYPHIASNNKWWTGIVAYNPSASGCTLTVKPYTAAGTPLATKTVMLEGGEKYIGTIKNLGMPAESAWFQIESTRAITGFELFGTSDNTLLAGYTGVNISSKKGVFAKLEKSGWTGIAFVNITQNSAGVELMAINDAGTVIATESITLNPYQKIVDNPENIFTRDISNATYIAYSSGRELVGFQLNGSADNMMLDGLPGLFAASSGDMSQYDGNYYGTYSGDALGDWCFDISNGTIYGWAWDNDGIDYEVSGTMSGDGSLAVGSADDSTTFSGTIDPDGDISGTWDWFGFGFEPDENGTFEGQAGDCPMGEITIDEDIEMVIDGTTESLADEGGLGTFSLMLEALEEMGLTDALGADSVIEMLTILAGTDSECGSREVNKFSGTVVYTITGGAGCLFNSGTITISNITKNGDEISFDAEFEDVTSETCSLNGNAEMTITENASEQIEFYIMFDQMETCNGEIEGTFDVVYDSSTEEIISASADVEASYMVDGSDMDVEADIEYNSFNQLNGTMTLTIEGISFDCILENIEFDQDCGVPTAGSLTIQATAANGLEEDVVFDFSGTTCANPTVTTTINGRTVTYAL